MKAAVLQETNGRFSIEDVQLTKPLPNEVLIRTVATGICHSDLSMVEGKVFIPHPIVLGHETAGVVEAVGENVRGISIGDHVVACLSVYCGRCEECCSGHTAVCGQGLIHRPRGSGPRILYSKEDGGRIHQGGGIGGYAEYVLLTQDACVPIRKDMPLDRAAIIGCAVVTGMGAVTHATPVPVGATVAVLGCGGVGLTIVNGAAIAGASRIIAIDRAGNKRDLALEMGATDFIDASQTADIVETVRDLTGGGVGYSFEAIGLSATLEQAFAMVRPGGTTTMVGVPALGTKMSMDTNTLLFDRTLRGTHMGTNRFPTDIPHYVDLYMQGRLKLDRLISRHLPLEEINSGFDELRTGQLARSVIMFDN